MRQRLTEIGHAAPDDEAAHRAGHGCNRQARQKGALEERLGEDIKHEGQCRCGWS